nr:hypothetical protein CFP56_34616 [Quercus suber]
MRSNMVHGSKLVLIAYKNRRWSGSKGISVSFALQSNGVDVTPSCGPPQFWPLTEVDKAIPEFVLGPGDVISEALNPTRRNIRGTKKKHGKSVNGENVKKDSKDTGK